MLTPAEISGKVFEKAVFSGYHMAGVDEFLESVTADYTALYKENGILKNKLKVLVEKIEEYRATEDAMRMALLTAQKTGEEILAKKEREGTELVERMERDATSRRREIDNLLADENARLKAASDATVQFVERSKQLLQEQLDFLSKLDTVSREPAPVPAPPTREDIIQSAAREIDVAVEKLFVDGSAEPVSHPDESEPTKTFSPKSEEEEASAETPAEDDTVEHRFDNLQFGTNFKLSE